jgi:hypothetical protein
VLTGSTTGPCGNSIVHYLAPLYQFRIPEISWSVDELQGVTRITTKNMEELSEIRSTVSLPQPFMGLDV